MSPIKQKQRKAIRFDLARKYGWVCWYCGQKLTGQIHIDHIVPASAGGTDDLDNLALACGFCNMAKQDYPLSIFLDWLDAVRFGHAWCPIRDGAKSRSDT